MTTLDKYLKQEFSQSTYIDLLNAKKRYADEMKAEKKEIGYVRALTFHKLNNVKLEILRRDQLTIEINPEIKIINC